MNNSIRSRRPQLTHPRVGKRGGRLAQPVTQIGVRLSTVVKSPSWLWEEVRGPSLEGIERLHLADNNLNNETALDSSSQEQHTEPNRQWVVMRQTNSWQPPTDVFELEDRLIVMVEIAGMRDGEFNVSLQDRRLMISGVRRRVVNDRMAFHQMEVRYGEFRTEVSLPWSVNRDEVSALYRDGFLRIDLPRALNQQIHIVDVDNEPES